MAAEGVLRALVQERPHPTGVQVAHLLVERGVEAAHGSHRVGQQLLVVEVAAPVRPCPVVEGDGRPDGEGALALPLLGGGARVATRRQRTLSGVG